MGTDKLGRSATEREWVGAAVRRRRLELGLRQKDAAELISAAGPHVTQQVLAKIEKGEKLLEVGELLAVCFALDTTLVELLFPVREESSPLEEWTGVRLDSEVVPDFVTLSTGKELPIPLVLAVASGVEVDPLVAEGADLYSKRNTAAVSAEAVLDLRTEYLGDPAAVAVGELLKLGPSEVTELVRQHARGLCDLLGLPTIARRKVTASDVLDALWSKWKLEHPGGVGTSEELRDLAVRQIRTALTRTLASALEQVTSANAMPMYVGKPKAARRKPAESGKAKR